MDGTLTIAQHDFDAIRSELGLPNNGQPILETLDKLPEKQSQALHRQLNQIELDIAHQSKAADGAAELLEILTSRGIKLGIVTRNNAINVEVTLKAAGLSNFFMAENLLSRDCAPPKPSPAAILRLLTNWSAKTDDAVMVGDHLHDLRSGRAAGVTTIYIDPKEEYPFISHADISVKHLNQISQALS